MMPLENRNCTLCGPGVEKKVLFPATFESTDLNATIFSARRTPDRRHFQMVRCQKCGMVYSDPACDPAVLIALYGQSAVNYSGQEEQIYDSYAPVLDRGTALLETHGLKRRTFLEIGGGRGFMLRYGAEKGFAEQIEVEPSEDAEKRFTPPSAQARFIRGILTPGVLPPASVSFACFFQMLDHVPDPLPFLKDVYELLEPGGVAVCVTHDTEALSAKILGQKSPIYDVQHTYLFNAGNLGGIFKKAGFEIHEVFPISNSYALKYWASLAPIPGIFRKLIRPVLEGTPVGDLRINLKAGNLGIVAYKSCQELNESQKKDPHGK